MASWSLGGGRPAARRAAPRSARRRRWSLGHRCEAHSRNPLPIPDRPLLVAGGCSSGPWEPGRQVGAVADACERPWARHVGVLRDPCEHSKLESLQRSWIDLSWDLKERKMGRPGLLDPRGMETWPRSHWQSILAAEL